MRIDSWECAPSVLPKRENKSIREKVMAKGVVTLKLADGTVEVQPHVIHAMQTQKKTFANVAEFHEFERSLTQRSAWVLGRTGRGAESIAHQSKWPEPALARA